MARKREDAVKLTETGARLLSDWLENNGVRRAELGEHLGFPNQMGAHRALTRKGRLTFEQVGRAVALTGGKVTAAELVGEDLAGKVPVLPPVERTAPADEAEGPAEPVATGDGEADVIEMAKRTTAKNIATLEWMRDHAKSQSLRIRAAEQLTFLGHGRPRQQEHKEKVEFPVTDEVVLAKVRRLLEDAKAKLQGESHG